jgi:type IV pilus assembly protein PilA
MMLQNLRAKIGARLNGDREAGFTLIELLVVMLILGILAAIAIPAFFNQKNKANDAQSKAYAKTAQTAMETYATDHNGTYEGATPAKLIAIEETLGEAILTGTEGTEDGYEIVVTTPGAEARTFGITRDGASTTFPCTVPVGADRGGCPEPVAPATEAFWSN